MMAAIMELFRDLRGNSNEKVSGLASARMGALEFFKDATKSSNIFVDHFSCKLGCFFFENLPAEVFIASESFL